MHWDFIQLFLRQNGVYGFVPLQIGGLAWPCCTEEGATPCGWWRSSPGSEPRS